MLQQHAIYNTKLDICSEYHSKDLNARDSTTVMCPKKDAYIRKHTYTRKMHFTTETKLGFFSSKDAYPWKKIL